MKSHHPLWSPTLAWMAAIVAALVLALFGPDFANLHNFFQHDAITLTR